MDWGLLALVIVAAIALNLPFGAWRTTTRKLSWQWFLSIHLPIPFIFVMRRAAGFGWDYVPVMIACAVTGQLLGGWLFARLRPDRVYRRPASESTVDAADEDRTPVAATAVRHDQRRSQLDAAVTAEAERVTS